MTNTVDWPAWRCPEHLEPLREGPNELVCPQSHNFKIAGGVPRFVSGSNYADHFGAQWNRFRKTQLDSHVHSPISEDRLRRCLGERLWGDLAGKNVLECGCGAGRFTEILLARGAKVTSIDLSSAVEANADQFPPGDSHRVAQADIGRLPFAPESFDIVICLGVVQHTPNSDRTISDLYKYVAPGGTLVIDHYYLTLSWYLKTAPLFRIFMKRMEPKAAMSFSRSLVDTLLPLHKAVQNVPVVRSIVHRLSPVMCYYTMLPQLNEEMQHEWAVLDTHDSLTDEFKHSRNKDQISQTLRSLGAVNIWCEYGGNGVEARGNRPARN
jgi:2-polyprenyl-3-methyl-5-hydroxy-6-metoxy-1,4-benzoquinol methylase